MEKVKKTVGEPWEFSDEKVERLAKAGHAGAEAQYGTLARRWEELTLKCRAAEMARIRSVLKALVQEGSDAPDVCVGQVWRDRDPRVDRTVLVTGIFNGVGKGEEYVTIIATGAMRATRVRLDRLAKAFELVEKA